MVIYMKHQAPFQWLISYYHTKASNMPSNPTICCQGEKNMGYKIQNLCSYIQNKEHT